jgi:type IV pilus assembly protein PilO
MALRDKLSLKGLGTKQKVVLYGLVVVAVLVGYYYLYYSPVKEKINALQEQKVALEGTIKEQRIIAKDLETFKKEVVKLEVQLNELLEQLPNSSEIPKLLRNISDVGKESGLDFLKFAPKGEAPKEFYAEIPVDVSVNGSFHEFGMFLDRVSRLSRIVNISDVLFDRPAISGDKAVMTINCTARTFRFLKEKKAGK